MNLRTLVWKPLIAVTCLAIILWLLMEPEQSAEDNTKSASLLKVTVVEPLPSAMTMSLTKTGITQPRWPVDVVSTISGRVAELPEDNKPGRLLEQDSLLVAILDTPFRAEVQANLARLAQAELELARIQHERHVTTKISKGNKLSEFGRMTPHLKAAQAEVDAAKIALDSARQQLQDTQVTAPFAALIMSQSVTPGQWINAGERLYQLASRDFLDIRVELSPGDWDRLGGLSQGTPAEVVTRSGNRWQAKVRYINPALDPVTRQRAVILEVASPYDTNKPLLTDQQVSVHFDGPTEHQVVAAPASTLTQDGQVWSVSEGKLQLEAVELLDEDPEQIWFRFRQDPAKPRPLVKYPLSSMLTGQAVDPRGDDLQIGSL